MYNLCVLEFNNGLVLQYGESFLNNLNIPGYSVVGPYTITFPIVGSNFKTILTSRNNNECDLGIVVQNYSSVQFYIHNNSQQSRTIYSVCWICCGY